MPTCTNCGTPHDVDPRTGVCEHCLITITRRANGES